MAKEKAAAVEKTDQPQKPNIFGALMAPVMVDGFDPYKAVVAYPIGATGKYRMKMPAGVSMAWFRAKMPDCRIDVTPLYLNPGECAYTAHIIDANGAVVGIPGAGSCKRGDEDWVHINYIQTAMTYAIKNCLRNNGFREPADAVFIEGVTPVYDENSEDAGDNGVVVTGSMMPPPQKAPGRNAVPINPAVQTAQMGIAPAATVAPAVPTASSAKQQENSKAQGNVQKPAPVAAQPAVPAPEPAVPDEMPKAPVVTAAAAATATGKTVQPKQGMTVEIPEGYTPGQMTLEEAEKYPLPGRYEGMTFKEGLEQNGTAFVRYFMGTKFAGTPLQEAARMLAKQNGF